MIYSIYYCIFSLLLFIYFILLVYYDIYQHWYTVPHTSYIISILYTMTDEVPIIFLYGPRYKPDINNNPQEKNEIQLTTDMIETQRLSPLIVYT